MAAATLLAGSALAGCDSTQDKAQKLRASGSDAFDARGLRVKERSREVSAGKPSLLRDSNGIAVVVPLRNRTARTLRNVPISIDVRDRKGKSLFRNDDPGLEPSLVGISVLRPRERVTWVNDQVFAAGKPAKVVVRVGKAKALSGALPKLSVTAPRYERDPVSGLSVSGKVRNASKLLQRKLVLYAVARRGGRIVAAGRGGIERLQPGRRAGYQIFFIGKPADASVSLAMPPTTLDREER